MEKKTIWFWGIGLATGLYATFVLQQLWNWFLVPTLNVTAISFWMMYGLHMFVTLLSQHGDSGWQDEMQWEGAMTILEACVPDARRESLAEEFKQKIDGVWLKIGFKVFGRVLEYSITLAIGWGIHAVLN